MNTIAAVSTRTGLTVTAELDTGDYPRASGQRPEMKDLEKSTTLHRNDYHGESKYTVNPGTQVRVLFFHADYSRRAA